MGMSDIKHLEPVFPEYHGQSTGTWQTIAGGLNKRELFAAMAMQGLLSGNRQNSSAADQLIANWSVNLADALIAELEKKNGIC